MRTELSDRLVDHAVRELRDGRSFPDVLASVLAEAADDLPSPAWEALAATDVAADVERAAGWLVRQLEERWPPADLSALRFGLFPVRGPRPGRTELVVALSGGPHFPDPAWLFDQTWDPVGYAPTPGLRALLPTVADEGDEVRGVVGRGLALAYVVGLVAGAVDAVDAARLLGSRPQLGVAAGFPGDEMILVGVLTAAGLDRTTMARIDQPQPDAPPPSS